MLADPPPQHGCRDIAPTALALRVIEDLEDDPLLSGQAVPDVGDKIRQVSHHFGSLSSGTALLCSVSIQNCNLYLLDSAPYGRQDQKRPGPHRGRVAQEYVVAGG